MMLTIHGLPSSVKYQELKALIKQKCNISQFILDNLVSEEDGTKKVRIGVADESEGTILVKNLYGYNMNGCRLRIQPVGKTPLLTTPKQANYDSRVNYEPRSEYSTQAMDPHGTSRAMDPHGTSRAMDPHGTSRAIYPPHTSKPTNYPYQHGTDVLQKMDSGPYSQREVYAHNRPQEQTYGYQTKTNVPMVNEDRRVVEIRPHILRTVELEHGPAAKPYQPAPQTYSQPQQKPVTIFKDNFQGPTQGYNFNQMNQPIQQSYQGRQDVTRPAWAQDQSKLQLGYVKPSVASYDKSSVYEERKIPHHPLSENQQTRALLKTPTNYDHPKYSHMPQSTRMSPPRRSSPVRRISPNKRLLSPQGRQDLRKPSPSRGASPRRRMSPSRRPSPRKSPPGSRRLLSPPPRRSPPRKSPPGSRRLLSPPPRRSPPRTSPPRRPYYDNSDKYNNRSSGHHAPQVRSAHEKQAQNQYSGDYGSSSSQNRAPPTTKPSAPWQGIKSIYPRDSPKERDIARYAPENKYQSAAKPGYPRDSLMDREIIRHAPENKNQHGAKPMYPRHSPVERSTVKRAPENKYQHFDILSVKELHHASTSAPLKRSRSPVRRNRTPPRRSPRKQSPPRRPWPQDRERSPLLSCPPSPPSWPHRSRDEKEHPIVWQRNEEVQHRDHHIPEEDWKKGTGFVDSRDKYDSRSEFTGRSNDRVPMDKYYDEPRRPSSPQRKEYYPGPESGRQHDEYKRHVLDRRDQIVKHHEDYAKRPEQYPKHQDVPIKYPEPFAKAPEGFNKNQEQPYKRHEEFPTRHGQFSGDDGQFPGRSAHHSPRHQGSFPKRQEPLLKYEEPVRRYQEPLLKYGEPVATRPAPPPKYSEPVTKRHDLYGRPQEQYTKHQEPFSKRQEKNPMHQDQYSDRRDDHYKSDENRKQHEEFRYSADNKHIDKRPGRPDDASWREAKEATQKPEGSFTELSKRAQDWAQGIGKYGNTAQEEKNGVPVDPQLRQKAINVITRKILARHNVKMKDDRQKKISICLRKMIEKRVNNIIGKRDMNLLEIQQKFRQTHSVQDEEKMYFDAVAVYPQKRHIEDSCGPPQKMAKRDDRNMDNTESYFGNASKKTRWDIDVYSDDQLDTSSNCNFETMVVDMDLQDSCDESNECIAETFSLYLCKDDFSVITGEEADTIRQFLFTKIFDATANSLGHGWAPSFTMCGLRSLCRYEIETDDLHSKIWLEQLDFSDLEGFHIVVYNKEELWYERAAIWLPGHSKFRKIEPLEKLRLQNRLMTAIDLSKWKLVKKIVTAKGTRIYVDMPSASARVLESHEQMLSYELQKVSVFLKAVAVDKDTFDSGLRESSINDTTELIRAIQNTPMPSIKKEPRLIMICLKGGKLLNVEQAKKIKEKIVFKLYKYLMENDIRDCSRTDFLKYGFCLPGYLGVLPENRESASWLMQQDLGRLNRRQKLMCFGGETNYQNSIKMTMQLKPVHDTPNHQTILKTLDSCNRFIAGLNFKNWQILSLKRVRDGLTANVKMNADSAKALSDNSCKLKYADGDAVFTHE